MTGFNDKLDLTQELHTTERTPAVLFAARVLERGLQQVATGGWATASRSLDALSANLLHRVCGEGTDHVIAERDGTLVQLGLYSGWIQAQVAGDDAEQAAAVMAELKDAFPPPDPSSTHRSTSSSGRTDSTGPSLRTGRSPCRSGGISRTTTARPRESSSRR